MPRDLTSFEPKKILVCQQRQIGDVVISTACVELLRKRYAEAELHFLTEAKCLPALENNPHLRKIWSIDKSGGLKAALRLYRDVRRERFDMVVDFQRLPRCRMVSLLSGAPVRLTFPAEGLARHLYTHTAGRTKGGYAGELKATVLEALGIEWNFQPPKMYLSGEENAWAERHLREQGLTDEDTLVTVDPTHWSKTRRWPAEYWAEWVRLALRERPDLRFYLLHGPGERETVRQIIADSDAADRCMQPGTDSPSLRQAAAVIARSTLQVGNCSAPRHMATALGLPTLTIIGSNGDTAWTFPDKTRHRIAFNYLPCSKCNSSTCARGDLECLYGLRPETVLRLFLEMLPAKD